MNGSTFHAWQLESVSRFHHAFGALILRQAVHSTEVVFVAFGVWTYLVPVRSRRDAAPLRPDG